MVFQALLWTIETLIQMFIDGHGVIEDGKAHTYKVLTKSLDKHSGIASIKQMHPLLHNGQSWMHTRATKPLVPGKTHPPEGLLR
uniref:Uncharacterized protein n=1 Tax=Helianthus annuus TaxID=4232 RepID=A0A251V5E5_HELAN